jgi:predicted kinase
MTRLTYERLVDTGTSLAADGYTVILDAKFDRVWQRFAAMEAAGRLQLPLSVLYLAAPHAVLRERLRTRGEDISDATAELLEQQVRQLEAFTDAERPFVTTLETRQPAEAVAEDVARMFATCSAVHEG